MPHVWATENTREAIFDAMKRREVYATSGPRMTVRFFGGFDFQPIDVNANRLVRTGYEKGVPDGWRSPHSKKKRTPTFLIAAQKDSSGANLDRVQVVKGCLTRKARPTKRSTTSRGAMPIAASSSREGELPPVGNTVDVKNATGATRLAMHS